MKHPYHNERIAFRFVGFPKKAVPLLKKALPGVELKMGKQKKTQKLVISFQLNKNLKHKKLRAFLRQNKISPNTYGLWVSLVTERDSDGVRVPAFAAELFRKVGGKLDFSFTSV